MRCSGEPWRFPPFRSFRRRTRACSRERIRAEPNITIVSPTFSRRRRSSGSMYSVRIRTGRAGKLSINTVSRYGGSISTLLCLLRDRRLMKPPLQNGCGHYLFTLNPEGEPAKISYSSSFYASAASKRQQHGLIIVRRVHRGTPRGRPTRGSDFDSKGVDWRRDLGTIIYSWPCRVRL